MEAEEHKDVTHGKKSVAKKIALDHLVGEKMPTYYEELPKMEKKLKSKMVENTPKKESKMVKNPPKYESKAHEKKETKAHERKETKREERMEHEPKTKVAKGVSLPRGKEEKLREKPGSSSTGKYKNIAPKDFAGKAGGASKYPFPIEDLAHARNALARAHFAPNPEALKRKVYTKYPELKKHHEEKEKKSEKKGK